MCAGCQTLQLCYTVRNCHSSADSRADSSMAASMSLYINSGRTPADAADEDVQRCRSLLRSARESLLTALAVSTLHSTAANMLLPASGSVCMACIAVKLCLMDSMQHIAPMGARTAWQ